MSGPVFFYVGVDPGDSTGVAAFREHELIWVAQDEPTKMLDGIEVLLTHATAANEVVAVGCERFVSRPGHHTHQPTAQRVIGAVERLTDGYGQLFYLQGPADAHAIASNDDLRKMGLFQRRSDVDQRDAMDANMAVRHALLVMSRHSATTFERVLNARPTAV